MDGASRARSLIGWQALRRIAAGAGAVVLAGVGRPPGLLLALAALRRCALPSRAVAPDGWPPRSPRCSASLGLAGALSRRSRGRPRAGASARRWARSATGGWCSPSRCSRRAPVAGPARRARRRGRVGGVAERDGDARARPAADARRCCSERALWARRLRSLLPWIVRGRNAALDVVAVTVWSAACWPRSRPSWTPAPARTRCTPTPRGAVLGAVLGGVLAVAARALRGPV